VIEADVEAPTSVLSELVSIVKPLLDAPLCVATDEKG
jgi:biopolymer transport protein ExbD